MRESIFDRMRKSIDAATEANNSIKDDILPSIEKSVSNIGCAADRLMTTAKEIIAKKEKE